MYCQGDRNQILFTGSFFFQRGNSCNLRLVQSSAPNTQQQLNGEDLFCISEFRQMVVQAFLGPHEGKWCTFLVIQVLEYDDGIQDCIFKVITSMKSWPFNRQCSQVFWSQKLMLQWDTIFNLAAYEFSLNTGMSQSNQGAKS